MFYFSLFLPTSSTSQDENGWRLWFDEFFTIWKALSNGIGQNIEWNLFVLFSNLAWQSIGQIDWTDHVEFLFSKFMFRLDLSSCFGEASTEYHSRINPTGIAMWIVANLGGKDGQEIQKYTMKMFDAIQSFYHPANSDKVSEELAKFVEDLVYFLIKRLHDERHNIKKECLTPEEKRLTDQNVIDFIKKMIPLAFDMLYSGCNCANVFKTLSTISPEMIIPLLVKNLLNDNTWTNLMPLPRFQRQTSIQSPTDEKPLFRRMLSLSDYSLDNFNPLPEYLLYKDVNKDDDDIYVVLEKFNANLDGLQSCLRPFVENYGGDVIKVLNKIVPFIEIFAIERSEKILSVINTTLSMIWLLDEK